MINIQNNYNNECFKWSLVRYLYPEDHHPARITKADKDFARVLYLKDIRFPVKIRDIYKIEKTNSIALAFLVMKIRKNIQSMYQKNAMKKTGWFISNRKRRQKALSYYQRFLYIYAWLYVTSKKKTFLPLLFTSFQYRRNIKAAK